MKKTYEYKTTNGAAIAMTVTTTKIENNINLDGHETNVKDEPVWFYEITELLVNEVAKKATFKNLDMTIASLGKSGKNEMLLAIPVAIVAEIRNEEKTYNLAKYEKITKQLEKENARMAEAIAVEKIMDATEDRAAVVTEATEVAEVTETKKISVDNGNSFVSASEAIGAVKMSTIMCFMDYDKIGEILNKHTLETDEELLEIYLQLADEDLIIG